MPASSNDGVDRITSSERNAEAPRGEFGEPASTAPAFSCLSEVDLFADLTPAEIQMMDVLAPARTFLRGELVFSQSQAVTALFILKRGRVRVFRVTEDGKALTMAILEPGAVFGEMVLVGQRMYDNFAEAIEDSAICRLDVSDVERFFMTDPRIATRIARLLGEQVIRLEERLTDLAHRPLAARIARTILTLSVPVRGRRAGARVVRITHEQLASLVGASREATSKTTAELAHQGIIRQGRGRLLVVDPVALGAIARRTA